MTLLRAGIIGLGVGESHIEGYRRHPACEVVALAEFDADKAAAAREKYPEMRVHESAERLIDDPTIDVISIASFDTYHSDQVIRSLNAGKHVFVEKPLCLTESEFAAIRTAHRTRPDLILSSNVILRRSPRFLDLKQRIAAGELGQIFNLEGDYNYGRIHKLTEGWRGTEPYYSVVHGGGVHIVDLLEWLAGDRVVEVSAFGNRIATEGSKFHHDSTVVAILRFDGGAVGKMTANFGCVFPHFHRLAIYGTKASFVQEPDDARLYRSRDPAARWEVLSTPYPAVAKGDLIPSFVAAVLGEGEADVTTADVFRTMALCLAIERAARTGNTVYVDEIMSLEA